MKTPPVVCPADSAAIFRFALKETLQKDFFRDRETGEIRRLAEKAASAMPEDYFPDTFLEISLSDREPPLWAFRMDSRECNLVNWQSGGRYFRQSGVPAIIAPECRRRAAGLAFTGDAALPFEGEDTLISPGNLLRKGTAACRETEPPEAAELIRGLRKLPVQYEVFSHADGCTVTFDTGTRGPRNRFSAKGLADALLALLAEQGFPVETLSGLKSLSCNYGMPFYDAVSGYLQWVICVDIAYFTVRFRGGRADGCRVGILLTDKTAGKRDGGNKPAYAYQWHITDNCDQRCKHCYLFAEDARLKCVTTPWEMLMRTLDECELDAAKRHAWPMLAVTGGDPILHPQFWQLAEEIHRRGIRWLMMGNPFHLNREVCRRLGQFGVTHYQMSLDGLEPFHDYMRKPGSYRATLEAIRWLSDAGVKPQLMATASRKNLDDIIALMDVAAEYGAFSLTFARYCATSPEKAADYPAPEEYRRFLAAFYDKGKELERRGCKTLFLEKEHLFTLLKWERGEFTVPAYSEARRDLVCEGCHLGRGCCILANGDVLACRRMESVVGNVWKQSLWELQNSAGMKNYAEVKNIKKCRDCELLNWCRGCRAVGFNATGDLQAADPCCWKE